MTKGNKNQPTLLRSLRKHLFAAALLGAGLCGFSAHAAEDWWNDEWNGRLQVTLNTTEQGAPMDEAVETVPVLVRLHGGNFPFGVGSDDGSDIRFVADDQKTTLAHHIEKYDDLLQEAIVWVNVPKVEPGAENTIWLYYNKTGLIPKGEDAAGTFDDSTVLAYHFSENGSAPADASGNGNHAENAGIPIAGSLIGGGLRLTGNHPITIPDSPTLAFKEGGAVTVSAWVSPVANSENATVLYRRTGNDVFEMGLNNGLPYAQVGSVRVEGTEAVVENSWKHLSTAVGNGELTLYVDGKSVASAAASLPAMSGPLQIGGNDRGQSGFAGEIDELKIATDTRPQPVLAFEAINQGNTPLAQQLLTLTESAENAGGWLAGDNYFAVIINSVNADGWTILILLAFMSLFSWVVMIIKFAHLSSIGKANRKFVRMWRNVATDLTVLDNPEQMETFGGKIDAEEMKRVRRAPIYRLYHTGIEEIRHRFDGSDDSKVRKLSGASVEAIRASMDTTYVREGQKLNSKIVYLTLSISGGPFLGLLGTVLGVTITFAAIAAAGDVNINSIAPGIAAALLTTIAGLCVAIPALFGYNYLVSRIKELTSDMRVFTDEFIAKAAEFYSKKGAAAQFAAKEVPVGPGKTETDPAQEQGPSRSSETGGSDQPLPQPAG